MHLSSVLLLDSAVGIRISPPEPWVLHLTACPSTCVGQARGCHWAPSTVPKVLGSVSGVLGKAPAPRMQSGVPERQVCGRAIVRGGDPRNMPREPWRRCGSGQPTVWLNPGFWPCGALSGGTGSANGPQTAHAGHKRPSIGLL